MNDSDEKTKIVFFICSLHVDNKHDFSYHNKKNTEHGRWKWKKNFKKTKEISTATKTHFYSQWYNVFTCCVFITYYSQFTFLLGDQNLFFHLLSLSLSVSVSFSLFLLFFWVSSTFIHFILVFLLLFALFMQCDCMRAVIFW